MYLARLIFSLICIIHLNCFPCYGYKHYYLEGENICFDPSTSRHKDSSRNNNNKLVIGTGSESAIIIEKIWKVSMGVVKPNCTFGIRSRKHIDGLYTVIKKMKLRGNPTTGACIDYIQLNGDNPNATQKLCGNIGYDDRPIFLDLKGDIQFIIYINPYIQLRDDLEISIVITAHNECNFDYDFRCNPKDDKSCISVNFVKDDIINCMPPCSDEENCMHILSEEVFDQSNIIISAITSSLFTMIGVIACIWLCWTYRDCFHFKSSNQRQTTENIDPIELPSAPNLNVISENNLHRPQSPKDLPPSYESLFPDR